MMTDHEFDVASGYGPCTHCGEWHRADFNCDTAARVERTNMALNPCGFCKKNHPLSITCQMVPAWEEWKGKQDRGMEATWGPTIEEAWRMAESVGRLDIGIKFLERTEPLRRQPSARCDPAKDGDDDRAD